MFRNLLLFPTLVFMLLFVYSCEKNPTEPEPTPGRRDYVWKLDTLDMPVNYIGAVWGAAPNDVWAVGAGGTEHDRLQHFDGEEWKPYDKEIIWCTGKTLFGFSTDNVWMGGGGGWLEHGAAIWHYDGDIWSQHYVYDIDSTKSIFIQNIWGTAPNDIYASGMANIIDGQNDGPRGFLLHFNGKNWKPVIDIGPFNSQFVQVRKDKNKIYLQSAHLARLNGGHFEWVLYEVDGDKAIEIYAGDSATSINNIGSSVFFVINNTINKRQNGNWVEQFSVAHEDFSYSIIGRHEKDIFLIMQNGIAHYNGEDIEYLYRFSNIGMRIMNQSTVQSKGTFLAVRGLGGNYVLRGELVE